MLPSLPFLKNCYYHCPCIAPQREHPVTLQCLQSSKNKVPEIHCSTVTSSSMVSPERHYAIYLERKNTFCMNKYLTPLAVMALFLVGHHATAQTAIFVKIMDQNNILIKGGSTNRFYTNQIEAIGFGQENTSCSTNSPTGGGGACAGKVGHFILNMQINESVPLLDKALCAGNAMKTVDIYFVRTPGPTPVEYYSIHLQSVYITHVTNSDDLTNAGTVQFELDAAKISWTFTPQSNTGPAGTPVTFNWNVLTNSTF